MFLNPSEISLIKCDFERILKSCESSTITGVYHTFTNEVEDDVYGISDYNDVTQNTFTGRAIQQIVEPKDKRLLDWGILDVGDCIFYFSKNLDIQLGEPKSMHFIDPGGNKWNPVIRDNRQFYEYILARIGSDQIAQAVPCKVRD